MKLAQPKTFDKREEIAGSCISDLKLTMPVLVDDMQDTVASAYNAMPDRLFVVGADGRIAYRGARGPRGFDVAEMEAALGTLLAAK